MLTATLALGGSDHFAQNFTVAVPQRLPFNRAAQVRLREFADRIARPLPGRTRHRRSHLECGHGGLRDRSRRRQALRLNGANGVRLPTGLISNYEYTVSFWINPTVITRFTTGFFGAVNERMDGAGFPFSTQWLSFLPQSWDGNTMLWSGSDQWFDGSAGLRIPAEPVAPPRLQREPAAWCRCSSTACGDSTAARSRTSSARGTGIFALGVNYWDLPFNGMIDELKVYEAALSAAEIRALDIDHLPTAELLASAATLLDLGDISAVREDLRLPRSGAYATAITWQSSNPAVLSNRGRVTRPGLTEPDANVTLTATLTLDGQLTTGRSRSRVKSLAPPVPVAAYRFEDNLQEASGLQRRAWSSATASSIRVAALSFTAGAVGRALVLNGATGVRLPDNLLHDHSYSISLWLNPERPFRSSPRPSSAGPRIRAGSAWCRADRADCRTPCCGRARSGSMARSTAQIPSG